MNPKVVNQNTIDDKVVVMKLNKIISKRVLFINFGNIIFYTTSELVTSYTWEKVL